MSDPSPDKPKLPDKPKFIVDEDWKTQVERDVQKTLWGMGATAGPAVSRLDFLPTSRI